MNAHRVQPPRSSGRISPRVRQLGPIPKNSSSPTFTSMTLTQAESDSASPCTALITHCWTAPSNLSARAPAKTGVRPASDLPLIVTRGLKKLLLRFLGVCAETLSSWPRGRQKAHERPVRQLEGAAAVSFATLRNP